MKKFIGIFLTSILLMATVSASFAESTNLQATEDAERAIIEKELKEMDERMRTESKILENVDASTLELSFDSVAEYEEALKTLTIVPIEDDNTSLVDENTSSAVLDNDTEMLLDTTYYEKVLTKDNGVYLLGIHRGDIRNKVVAYYYINSSGDKRFSSVKSQTSYPYNINTGLEWTQDNEYHSIIDSQRTLTSSLNGHVTISIEISGYPVGSTADFDFYNEWGYTTL